MPVPLRAVIVVLVVACIAVVAVLCTSLSVWSGDRALNDTLDSGRHSVDIAFAAGHETVVKVTEDYLKQIGESTVRQLASFWSITENSVSSVCQQLMADDMAMMESWTNLNSYRVQMYQLSRNHYEIDGLGIVSRKYQSVQVFQSRLTMARAETEYHHFHAILNNGTDHDILGGVHAINRTVVVDVIPGGKALAYEYATDAGKNVFPFCLGNGITAIMTDGAAFDPPCRYPEYDLVTKHLKAFLLLPQMGVGFNLQLVGLGDYVGMTTQCVYGNALTGERVGVVYGGSDMVKISHFLASIDIGQSRNSLGRIFVTVRKNWLSPGNMNIQHGYLAGTSHGSYEFPPLNSPRAMRVFFFFFFVKMAKGRVGVFSININTSGTLQSLLRPSTVPSCAPSTQKSATTRSSPPLPSTWVLRPLSTAQTRRAMRASTCRAPRRD